jgi:chemotaxis response regulator CheB
MSIRTPTVDGARRGAITPCRRARHLMGHILNEPQIARDLFAFGGSAGGLEALIAVFRRLPADLPVTICVALHRSPNSTSDLAGILARRCALPVSEPADGEAVPETFT